MYIEHLFSSIYIIYNQCYDEYIDKHRFKNFIYWEVTMTTTKQHILDVHNFRYACKQFDPTKEVSKEDFDTILEVGRLSPTSFGLEAYKILVLQDKELRCKIYPHAWGAQKSLEGASHIVVFLANKQADLRWGSDHMEHILRDIKQLPDDVYGFYQGAFTNFGENDFKTYESERATFDWACKQTYIVMANMLTAAAELGIDTCPIEGFVPAELNRILGDEAGLFDTNHYGISVMASFGYRAEEPHRGKARRPMDEVVLWK